MSVERGQTVKVQAFGVLQDCRITEVRSGDRIQVQPLGTPDRRRLIISSGEIVGPAEPQEPGSAEPAGAAVQALDGTVSDAAGYIATVESVEGLDRLAEMESAGDDRKGVHEAIAERREELVE